MILEQLISFFSFPSPVLGEGEDEGKLVGITPLTLTLSQIGRGELLRNGLVIAIMLLFPVITYAQGIVKCGPQQDNLCELQDLFELLVGIYNFLLTMAGIVAFGFLIWGGVQMLLFSVDEDHVKNGKTTVLQALIGLAIVALAYIIVNTLLLALGLTSGAGGYFDGTIFSRGSSS